MSTDPVAEKGVFLVTAAHLGADPELGAILLRAFLHALSQSATKPARMIFLNTGVHLTTRGSPVLEVLGELAGAGVELLSCGTCLDYFGKREHLALGSVTNMHATVESLAGPGKVVTLG